MREDLPTLERPMMANSGRSSLGQSRARGLLFANSTSRIRASPAYGPTTMFDPGSTTISAAPASRGTPGGTKSAVITTPAGAFDLGGAAAAAAAEEGSGRRAEKERGRRRRRRKQREEEEEEEGEGRGEARSRARVWRLKRGRSISILAVVRERRVEREREIFKGGI